MRSHGPKPTGEAWGRPAFGAACRMLSMAARPGIGATRGLPRSHLQFLGQGLAPWEVGRGGAPHVPDTASGAPWMPNPRALPLCGRRWRSGFPLAGGWASCCQWPGPSCVPPRGSALCPAPSTCSSLTGTPLSLRGQALAGGWTRAEAAARPRVGPANLSTAKAGAGVTPTLQMGTLRLLAP